jgi:hypothetical protein
VENVLDVLLIVWHVLQITNASIVRMVHFYQEEYAIMLALLVLFQTIKHMNVPHATLLVKLALIIQAHAQVANQVKVIFKLLQSLQNVSNNVLKVHSLKMEFVKYVILDALNVLALLLIALLVLLGFTYTMALVGIIVLV